MSMPTTDPERPEGSTPTQLYRCRICDRIIALKQGARSHVTRAHDGITDSAQQIEPVEQHTDPREQDETK
jgi:competence CoiA-like predicted nuclease